MKLSRGFHPFSAHLVVNGVWVAVAPISPGKTIAPPSWSELSSPLMGPEEGVGVPSRRQVQGEILKQ